MNLTQRTFGEIADLRNGINYVVADQGAMVKVVGVGDFQRRTEMSNFDSLSEIRLRSSLSPDDELRDGDLLFVRSNGNKSLIGRCMVIRNPPVGVTFSGFTIRARLDKSKVMPEYIALVFQGGALNRQMTLAGGGNGNISNLNQAMLAEMPVGLPSLEIQKLLVACASTWDTSVHKTEQLIAAKERYLAAKSHQILTARVRMNGFSKPWDSQRADEIFESTSRKGQFNEPLLSVTQERGVIPRDMLVGRVTMPSGSTSGFKLVEPGNFVISLRSFQGGLEHSDYRGLVSPAYTVLSSKMKIDERFFRHYFKSADFIKRLSVAVIGIRDGKQISFQDFCSIKLPFPSVDEQAAIAVILDEAEREIGMLRQFSEALKNQKRGLMQKLLTGQWRLKDAKEVAA